MGRLLVEILISASGAQASAGIDEVGASADRTSRRVESLIQSALRGETALRRTAEGAERLKDQMTETKAAKGMIADLGSLNTKLREELQAVKEGAVGIDRLNQKRREEALAARIAATQVRAGVSAESEMGKAIALEIREQDRLQAELRQTAAARGMSTPAGTGGWRIQLRQLGTEAGNLSQALAPLGIRIGGVSSLLSGMGAAIGPLLPLVVSLAASAGLLYAGFKAFGYLEGVVEKGLETQSVLEKLNNTLRSTGSYAGMSAADIVHLAEGYELLTGREKEEIISAETVLSRFQELGRDAFPKALESVLAYAKMTGDTAEVSANKLGPALAGNARSLNALKDIGIVLTAGQRKMLTEMVETGRVAEYQALLFDILKEKIGGVSDEFDKNLTRQAARARIVLDEFAEGIASEIIPALEDVFAEIIRAAGGWEFLQQVVTSVGHDVGNVIRVTIYGIVGMYHDWMAAHDELRANIQGFLSNVAGMFSEFLKTLGSLPTPLAPIFNAVGYASENLANNFAKNAAKFAGDADKHKASLARLAAGLREHRQALEADTKVYQAHGSAIDSVNSKNAEEERKAKQLAKIYKEQMETLRFLTEQKKLADRGPLDLTTRLKEEQRINDEHEYRLTLLKYEEQFGTKIAKNLADQEKFFKNLKRTVDVELKTSVKLDPIDMNPAAIKELNRIMKETEEQLRRDVEAFADFNKAQDDWLEQFAEGWKQELKKTKDTVREDIAAINAAVQEGYLTVVEGEEAVAKVRAEASAAYLREVGGFVNDLLAIFNNLSGGTNKWSTALGGLSGVISSGGTDILSWFKLMEGIATGLTSKGRAPFTGAKVTGSPLGIDVGAWTTLQGNVEEARKLARQIGDALNSLLRDINTSISGLPGFDISQNKSGWIVLFEDGLRRYFESFDEAFGFAVGRALQTAQFATIPPDVKQAIDNLAANFKELSFEELSEALRFAGEYAQIGVPEVARSLDGYLTRLLSFMEKANRLGLDLDKIGSEFGTNLQDVRDQLLGIQRSPEEQRSRDIEAFNKWIAQQSAIAKSNYAAAEVQLLAAQAQLEAARLELGRVGQMTPEDVAAFQAAQAALKAAALSMEQWAAIIANLPAPITPEEAEQANRGGRGGGGRGDDRASFRQDIRDRMAGFLGEIGSLFYNLDKEIADLTTRAKEAGVPLSELNELFARMREEARKTARNRMDELAGIGSDLGRELREGLDVFADLKKRGRKETGIPDWLLEIRKGQFLEGVKQRFQQSIAEFAGVADPMLAIKMRAAELRRGLKELADQGLLTAEDIAHAKDMIAKGEAMQREQGISGIMDQIFAYAKEAGIYSAEALENERKKVELNLRLFEAQLQTYGALDDATRKIINDLREWARSPAFGAGQGTGAGGGMAGVMDSFTAWKLEQEKIKADLRNEAMDILKSWRDAGKSALQRQLDDLAEQMGKVTAAFGNTAEIAQLHAQRLRAIITDYLEPLQSALDQQKVGSTSSLTGEQQFFESQRQFRELAEKARAAMASGNLGGIPDPQELTRLFNQYLEAGKGYTAGEGYRFIEAEARGVFQSIINAIPGLTGAGGVGASGAPTGSPTAPYTMQSPVLQAAIETGNTLLLTEARNQTAILTQIRGHVRDTASRLGETLSVREVA